MKYNKYRVAAAKGGKDHIKEVSGVRALSSTITELKSKGFTVADVSSVR